MPGGGGGGFGTRTQRTRSSGQPATLDSYELQSRVLIAISSRCGDRSVVCESVTDGSLQSYQSTIVSTTQHTTGTLALDLTHNIGRQTRAPNTTSTHSNDELITLFETIRLGGVAYSRGCGVFDGITILVEERGALPTSGLDARKAVHVTCRSSLILQSMQ